MTSTNFYYFSGFLSCVLIVMLLTTKLYLDNWNRFEFHKEDVPLEFVFENKSKVDEFLLKKFIIPNSRINYLNRTERFEFLNNFIDTQGYKNIWNASTLLSELRHVRKKHRKKIRRYVSKSFTLITAYWDLGTFRKGDAKTFSKELYMNWSVAFKYMLNPLVVYTDSEKFRDWIQNIRSDLLCCTKIIYMNRTEIEAFQRVQKIKDIYDQPDYPRYYPNTVNPLYPASQNAKFTVVADTYRQKLFDTTYYGWIDVGYFRDIVNVFDYYRMEVPGDFDSSRIAFNRVNNHIATSDLVSVFRDNLLWVGGGLFFGLGEVIDKFDKFYQRAVDYFLSLNVSNSDQQVLYSIYTGKGRQILEPPIEIQPYVPKTSNNEWFYLGFLCRKVVTIY